MKDRETSGLRKKGLWKSTILQERLMHGYYVFFYVMAAWLWVMFDVDVVHLGLL